jgi:hypothetical protein
MGRRLLLLALLPMILCGSLGGCRVMRYPSEAVLPDPIPDPPADVIAEVEALARDAAEARAERSLADQAVAVGQSLVGQAKVVLGGKTFNRDCSGFVRACLTHVGLDVVEAGDEGASGTEIFYRAIERRGGIHDEDLPQPGDLVFFSNTYDRNDNGELDDDFTHVGLVESVSDLGTIHFLHYIGGAVRIGRMNLLRPHDDADSNSGTILNDFLRRRRLEDSPGVRYLTSELWAGFGRITPSDPS